MRIITYINKGLNLFSFFFLNFIDFKLNYYVHHRNKNDNKIMVMEIMVMTKNKFFHQLSFSEFYADSEF
jgi:hypothetical protein